MSDDVSWRDISIVGKAVARSDFGATLGKVGLGVTVGRAVAPPDLGTTLEKILAPSDLRTPIAKAIASPDLRTSIDEILARPGLAIGKVGRPRGLAIGMAVTPDMLAGAAWAFREAEAAGLFDRRATEFTDAGPVTGGEPGLTDVELGEWSAVCRVAVQVYVATLISSVILWAQYADAPLFNILGDTLGAAGAGGITAWELAGRAYDRTHGR